MDTLWYTKETKVSFGINSDSSTYHVKCFIRNLKVSDLKIYNSEKIVNKKVSCNFEKWNTPLFKHNFYDVKESFLLENGIHKFYIGRQSIDILIQGASSFLKKKGIPVCFFSVVKK